MSEQQESCESCSLKREDFVAPLDVRWCPGCGDYAILNAVQKTLPQLDIPKENFVFVSGIGCSSRFPYYMNTYGMHTIHGRAPTVATGIKVANPELSVWVVTGDGDGLSIGGNHILHLLRRNLDLNVLLFNNRIYGLTKGQYSPTSATGTKTKTSPMGSLDSPINPLCIALASESTFVARTIDTFPKHMSATFKTGAEHKGTSFVEIFQNCVIFNNKSFENIAGREVRDDRLLMLEHGKPLLFGKDKNKGIRMRDVKLEVVTIGEDGVGEEDILVHNERHPNPSYAYLLSQMSYPEFPTPIGVFRNIPDKPCYETLLVDQIKQAQNENGKGDLQELLKGKDYWEVSMNISKENIAEGMAESVLDEMEVMEENIIAENMMHDDSFRKAFGTPVKDLMKEYGASNIISLKPESFISEAISLLREHNIGFLPVIKEGQLQGVLTEQDIIFKVLNSELDRFTTTIQQIMTPHEGLIIHAEHLVADALHQSSGSGSKYLLVDMGETNFGLISITGLIKFIYNVSSIHQKK